MSVRKSGNRKVLNTLLSKIRQAEDTPDVQYMVIYSFLYKYCSDLLKNYFKSLIEDKAMTFDEAYKDDDMRETFRSEALDMFGFYINSPEYYIDEVIASHYSDRFFVYAFFDIFSKKVEFADDSNYGLYFNFIFDKLSQEVNFNKFEFVGETHLVVKDIIYSISQLDVFEEDFPFARVFDKVCQSRMIRIGYGNDYINHLISSIVSSNVKYPRDVYSPFLNDASLLVDLANDYSIPFENSFAKSQDELAYSCSLVKLLINHFDLDRVFLELGSPFEPFDDSRAKFDVVISAIPQITTRNMRRFNVAKNPEAIRQNKRKQIEDFLTTNLNMDEESFKSDGEINDAIENIVSKMDLDTGGVQLSGEYAPLKDSEYLFLINMIDNLKDDGLMVVSMSQSFLFKNSLGLLRKYLTYEMNCIDAIMSVPGELSRHSISEIIMVFRKNRRTDRIVFIDMSTDFKTKKAPYSVPGLFRRNLVLDEDTIRKVLDVYRSRKTIDKFSNVVGISEIKANDFNLSISRYVDTFEGEFIDLKKLACEKKRLDQENRELSLKIEKMMKELGIDFK